MRPVDLHTHTTVSDGSSAPEQLLKEAVKAGLSAIAITDHDRVEAHHRLQKSDIPEGVELVPGIEFSSEWDGVEIHILGLYIDVYHKALLDELSSLWQSREERNQKILKKFSELSIPITGEDFAGKDLKRISKAHFCSLLVQRGISKSFQEAYERFFSPGGEIHVKRDRLSAQETIFLIRCAGGGAFLAHLNQIRSDEKEEIVKKLTDCGLCGIEGIYPEYNGKMTRFCEELAERYHLLLSGGSDYHGIYKKDILLGRGRENILVPRELLERIKDRLGK